LDQKVGPASRPNMALNAKRTQLVPNETQEPDRAGAARIWRETHRSLGS
jgi:hypothetical protein